MIKKIKKIFWWKIKEVFIFYLIQLFFLLKILDLNEFKMKVKNRVAHSLWGIKFDFDKYDNMPELLEIEAESSKQALRYIKKLNLEDKETLNWGSSSLFKHYWLEMKKYF